jgi:Xaa-Pro aminopeptidase
MTACSQEGRKSRREPVNRRFVIPVKSTVGIENSFVVTEQGGEWLSGLPVGIVAI